MTTPYRPDSDKTTNVHVEIKPNSFGGRMPEVHTHITGDKPIRGLNNAIIHIDDAAFFGEK